MTDTCILCNSKQLKIVQKIKTQNIVDLYLETLGIDVSDEISSGAVLYCKCNNCQLSFFDPELAGKESFYEKLQLARNNYYSSARSEFSFAQNHIDRNDNVLEIGSGSGFFANMITVRNYVGLEFNDKAIEDARAKGINLLKKDIETFSEENEALFDVVCSFHVLEHVPDPHSFIKPALKALKKGGKLIIAVPCNDSILTSGVNHTLNMPPHHINRFYKQTMFAFENIFPVKKIDFQLDFIETPSLKNYTTELMVNKILNLFYPNNKIVLSSSRYQKLKNKIHFVNRKLKLYRFFKSKLVGENMTFVFEKL